MITSALAGVQIQEEVTTLKDMKEICTPDKCLNLTLPLLFTPEGHYLTDSVEISRYLCATSKPELLGKSNIEKSQVDQWLIFLRNEVQPLARTLAYQVFGHVQTDAVEH